MYWTDAWKLGASIWANGVTFAETMLAANSVIGTRSRMIDGAMRNPFTADVGELGRIVPEKIAAFGKAGAAMSEDWASVQRDMAAQGRDMMSLFFSWPPNPATAARMADRGSRLALNMSMAGGRAMAPVHAAASANERRLRRP